MRRLRPLRLGDRERFGRLKRLHGGFKRGPVAPVKVEQQPLEVGGHLNVHGRRDGWSDRADGIVARRQRTVEDVVDVGRDQQPRDRQAHLRCDIRSEEHTSELQSLMRISYAVFCLKKKKKMKISATLQNES